MIIEKDKTIGIKTIASIGVIASALSMESPIVLAEGILEEIVVTARKRDESLQDVPVAVSAITAADIDKRGIVEIKDLGDQSPGFTISDNFSGKTDRTVQTFTLRGFSPSSGVETTASMFIDGVPVSSTTAISSVGSPERVEILRGPQSAYFGRNTFAGALNVVNREPGEDWAGSVEGTLGNEDYYRLRGEVEGQLIPEKLAFRTSAEMYDKQGYWDNEYDGSTLGDQKTQMFNALIIATPTDDLTIKGFGFYSHDEDGPAASAFVSAVDITDSAGNVLVQGQSNCTIVSAPYFCGTVPTKVDGYSYNTQATPEIKALLNNSENRITDTDMLDDYGMARDYQHWHLIADWDLGDSGFTLSSLSGYNQEQWILLNDIDHYGSDEYNYGYLVEREQEDWSQEFRLSYDNMGKFRGSVGISYLDATTDSTMTTLLSLLPVPSSVTPTGENEAETFGVFFGMSYNLTEKLTVSLEGRYQTDEIIAYDVDGNEQASDTFNNFLPRVIVDYKVNDDLMAYASIAQGVNPSAFNLGLQTLSDYVYNVAVEEGITLTVEPEEVTNYELGLKGSLLDGSVNFSTAFYYAQWKKQINRINIVVREPGTDMATSFSGVANTGEVDLYGLELEANWAISENLIMNVAAAYTGSDIKSYTNAAATSLTGISDFSGKEQPGVSKYSGNLGLQYDNVLSGPDLPWFARLDYIYKDGQWSNQANHVKTDDIHRVNLRAGITYNAIEVQAYVDNLLDDDTYTSSYDYYAFDASGIYFADNSGMVLGLSEPRTYGVKVKYSF